MDNVMYVNLNVYTVDYIVFMIFSQKERDRSPFLISYCVVFYIKFTRTSITPVPPWFEPMALPMIVPARALLFAIA